MRNNHHMKMIAWVMAIIMVLCAMPGAMAATGILPGVDYVDDDFAITKDNAFVKESYKTMDDSKDVNISNADRSQTYKLVLQVEEDANTAPFPEEGYYMIYTLPSVVESAESNPEGNGTVRWSYDANSRAVEFTWAGQKTNKFTAEITVKLANVFPLYNLAVAKINNNDTWFRLAKTTIKADKPYTGYKSGTGLNSNEYEAEPYDFSGITITDKGITYIAECDIDPSNPVPYFTANVEKLESQHTKIGGIDKSTNKPRWMDGLANSEKFTEADTTGGYHRNFRITYHQASEVPVLQPLYNFIGREDRKGSYFRLKKTQIIARDPQTIGLNKELYAGQYTLIPDSDYDFTNVVLTINGVEYRYSSVAPTGIYDNTYTVKLDRIYVRDKMHNDEKWYYHNEDAWLDNSKSTFTQEELENNLTWGIHRDYAYTLYKATATFYNVEMYDDDEKIGTGRFVEGSIPELQIPTKEGYRFVGWKTKDGEDYNTSTGLTANIKLIAQWESSDEIEQSVTITSNWPEGKPAFIGTKITLTAHPVGFVEGHYHVQWERSTDMVNWEEIEGANEINYVYVLDKDTVKYSWRVVVTDTE